jgi:hypothetical protein
LGRKEKEKKRKEKRKKKRGRSSSKQAVKAGRAVVGPRTGGATVLQVVIRCGRVPVHCSFGGTRHRRVHNIPGQSEASRVSCCILVGAAGVNAERRAHVDTEIQFRVNVKHLQYCRCGLCEDRGHSLRD